MNLGIAELWSLHLDDARRDLEEALALARRIGRPYLEIGCLGHLALAAVLSGSPGPRRAAAQRGGGDDRRGARVGNASHRRPGRRGGCRCARLARPLRRGRAVAGPRGDARRRRRRSSRRSRLLHYARGFVRLGQGRFEEALAEFRAAERLQPALAREHALPVERARMDRAHPGPDGRRRGGARRARGLDAEERDGTGMRIAAAALALADGRPEQAVGVLAPVIDGPSRSTTAHRRCSSRAGRPSTRCCSTLSRATRLGDSRTRGGVDRARARAGRAGRDRPAVRARAGPGAAGAPPRPPHRPRRAAGDDPRRARRILPAGRQRHRCWSRSATPSCAS